MIEQLKSDSLKLLGFKMSGKLHDEDYKKFVPIVEVAVAANGKPSWSARLWEPRFGVFLQGGIACNPR